MFYAVIHGWFVSPHSSLESDQECAPHNQDVWRTLKNGENMAEFIYSKSEINVRNTSIYVISFKEGLYKFQNRYVEISYHLHSTNNWLIFADFTSLFYESCLFLNINHFLNFPIVLLKICIEINNSVNTNQLTVWCANNKRL